MYNQEDLQQERWRQINTLKIFNDNVSQVTDNAEYKVDFSSGPNKFSLNVILTPDFPMVRPILKISPSINHLWVNASGDEIINAPGLLNFTRHSDLGRVVQAVIRELQRRPPLITSHVPNNVPSYNNYVPTSLTYQNHPPYPHQSYVPQSRTDSSLPDLSGLSLSELKLLDENEEYLDAYVKSLPNIQQLENVIDSLISTNESLANENLEKENKLKELTQETKEKVELLTELQCTHEMKNHQYDQLVERYSPHNIRERLLKTVNIHEEESERIADNFLDNKIDLDTFLGTYIDKRVVTHRLRAKEERLSFQLEALEKASY
ncbi:vacuolar protein sorting-associated protein 37A isoform X3 [Diaphorina citri]|uniref:Vacuolar protein sorting-associated protein 37A isoform X1 n=1 Tax=Diaphorina citri TaxID=121845 RepID=A0A3Q0ILN8_DIACI|nr:vacuolar protein sorting-associated protein 37A isoform X1 [Diaphorina citri]XP_026677206.1 vacuolar protein sorting-associated protein 37A isoform X3 [Diaphorina citri]